MRGRTLRLLTLALALATPIAAQEKPSPPEETAGKAATAAAPRARRAPTPLTLRLTLTRLDHDKVTSRVSYSLSVNADDPGKNSLRMGTEVPIPVTTFQAAQGGDSKFAPATSFQYRNVGINIDARAQTLDDGRYRLELTVEQSAVEAGDREVKGAAPGLPLFRTFMSSVGLLLRDGQSTDYLLATDPVTGEVARIEVSLAVRK